MNGATVDSFSDKFDRMLGHEGEVIQKLEVLIVTTQRGNALLEQLLAALAQAKPVVPVETQALPGKDFRPQAKGVRK